MVTANASTVSIAQAASRDTASLRPTQCIEAKTASTSLSSAPRHTKIIGRTTKLVRKLRPHLEKNISLNPTLAHVMTALRSKATEGRMSRWGRACRMTRKKGFGFALAPGVFMIGKIVNNSNSITIWLTLSTMTPS